MTLCRAVFAGVMLPLGMLLSGCSADFGATNERATVTPLGTISGQVYGGRQPVVGAKVFVLAASTAGYGGAGIAASTANASASLLTAYSTGSFPTTQDTTQGSATNGFYYVTTDSGGNFSLTGEYTCTLGQNVYLYAVGGQPSPGITNNVAAMMAVLGTCPASGTLASVIPRVSINELSTVATAFALAGFATDPLHIGDDEGVSGNTSAVIAKTGMANAFANAPLLYDTQSFLNSARVTTAGGNGTAPQQEVDALGNSLAACVNSAGASSVQCNALLSDATIDGASGAAATDTAAAAINIAHFPAHNASDIFAQATGIGTPFVPTLSSAPPDWSMGVKYTNTAGTYLYSLAADSAGSIWMSAGGYLVKLGANGGQLGAFSAGYGSEYNLKANGQTAVDTQGVVWTGYAHATGVNQYGYTYSAATSRWSSAGALLSTTYDVYGGNSLQTLALDGTDRAWWSPETTSYNIFSAAGSYSPVASGTPSPSGQLQAISIDPTTGGAWIVGYSQPYLFNVNSSGTIVSSVSTGISSQSSVAMDASRNLWVVTDPYNTSTLYRINTSGVTQSSTVLPVEVFSYTGVLLDGAGNVWFPGYNTSNYGYELHKVNNSGTRTSPTGGFKGSAAAAAYNSTVAPDASGNLWIISNTYVFEYVGLSVPVITPLSMGVKLNKLGTRP